VETDIDAAEALTADCGRVDARELCIDRKARRVTVDGDEAPLTFLEFELLSHLVQNREHVHSRGDLLREVWGIDETTRTRTVDTHIKRLRNKLRRAGRFIQCVRGAGYRYSEILPTRASAASHPFVLRARRSAARKGDVSERMMADAASDFDVVSEIVRMRHAIGVIVRALTTLPNTAEVLGVVGQAERLLAETAKWAESRPSARTDSARDPVESSRRAVQIARAAS
jgi:DNA-binding winged helix-turn-helix (wHTH) protein